MPSEFGYYIVWQSRETEAAALKGHPLNHHDWMPWLHSNRFCKTGRRLKSINRQLQQSTAIIGKLSRPTTFSTSVPNCQGSVNSPCNTYYCSCNANIDTFLITVKFSLSFFVGSPRRSCSLTLKQCTREWFGKQPHFLDERIGIPDV